MAERGGWRGAQITFRVTPYTYKRVLEAVNNSIKGAQKFAEGVAEDLAYLAAGEAETNFENAEYDGVKDVTVEARQTEKGNWSVTAKGESVIFIEYGAGVHFNGSGYPGDIPARFVGIGEYGQGKGKRDAWVFEAEGGETLSAGGNTFNRGRLAKVTVGYGYEGDGDASAIRSQRWDYDYDKAGRRVREEDGKTWVFTHGNPPNACMYRAFMFANEQYEGVVKDNA